MISRNLIYFSILIFLSSCGSSQKKILENKIELDGVAGWIDKNQLDLKFLSVSDTFQFLIPDKNRHDQMKGFKKEVLNCLNSYTKTINRIRHLILQGKQNRNKLNLLLGHCHYLNNKFGQAVNAYGQVLNASPEAAKKDISQAYNNIANVYIKRMLFQKGRSLLKKSLKLNPLNEVARLNLALLYSALGEHSNAKYHYKRLKRRFSKDPLLDVFIEINEYYLLRGKKPSVLSKNNVLDLKVLRQFFQKKSLSEYSEYSEYEDENLLDITKALIRSKDPK